jgi:hypothetical protein
MDGDRKGRPYQWRYITANPNEPGACKARAAILWDNMPLARAKAYNFQQMRSNVDPAHSPQAKWHIRRRRSVDRTFNQIRSPV